MYNYFYFFMHHFLFFKINVTWLTQHLKCSHDSWTRTAFTHTCIHTCKKNITVTQWNKKSNNNNRLVWTRIKTRKVRQHSVRFCKKWWLMNLITWQFNTFPFESDKKIKEMRNIVLKLTIIFLWSVMCHTIYWQTCNSHKASHYKFYHSLCILSSFL